MNIQQENQIDELDGMVAPDATAAELRAALRCANEQIQMIYHATTVSTWTYHIKTKIIKHQQRSIEVHGFGPVVLDVPNSLIDGDFVHPDDVASYLEMYDQICAGVSQAEGVFRVRTADRTGYWYEHICYTVLFDKDGKPDVAVGVSTDVTTEMENKISAETDRLTGLKNHRAFVDEATSMIRLYSADVHFLILFDLDNFKEFNDSYGHITGDRILAHVGQCVSLLIKQMKLKAICGRIGGDEFAVLISSSSHDEVARFAHRLSDSFKTPILDGISAHISLGAAQYPKDAADFDSLYIAADRAAYYVKRNGKNNFHFFDEVLHRREETIRQRRQFLFDTVEGGMLGSYLQEGLPFYFIDERMLHWLGYACENELIADTKGSFINAIHPADREYAVREIMRQMDEGDRYVLDYRIRKKDGSYIWIHDNGKKMIAPDGRRTVTSACYDITKEKAHADLIKRLVADANGGIALFRIEENWAIQLLYASEKLGELVDCSEEEFRTLCNGDAMNQVYEMDRQLVFAEIKRAITDDVPTSVNYRTRNRQGGYNWVNGTYSRFGEDNGRPVLRAVFMAVPIQYELQMELLNADSLLVYVFDKETKELYYANDTCMRTHGVHMTDFTGKTCHEVFYGRKEACAHCWCSDDCHLSRDRYIRMENGVVLNYELLNRRWNNRDVIIVCGRDVSRQYDLQKQRDELMNHIPCGVSLSRIRQGQYEVLSCNHRVLADMLGYEGAAETLDLNVWMRSHIHPDDLPAIRRFFATCREVPDHDVKSRCRMWNPRQASYVCIEIHANIVRHSDEQLVYATYCDVTKINQMQEMMDANQRTLLKKQDIEVQLVQERSKQRQLADALLHAQKADQAKGDFLSRMSHDMRTPMNAILGMAYLAEDEVKGQPIVTDYIRQIEESSQYLLGVINDILEMSRIDSGRNALNSDWYTLEEIVEPVIHMVGSMATRKGIRFEAFDPSSRSVQMYMDKQKTQQMLMNLLSNACKFTQAGGCVTLALHRLWLDEQAGTLSDEIEIRDTGCGMSKAFLEHIFNPFEQEQGASDEPGTGLGLTIARSIARQMGGDIAVQSELGKGSVFTVSCTCRFRKPAEENIKTKQTDEPEDLNRLHGKHVLLVEDNPLNAAIAEKLLEKHGIQVEHAQDGQRAVSCFAESPIGACDLILMDVRMPVMDGTEAAKRIRTLNRPDARTVPIVAMSANAYAEDRKKSLEAGMNDHLSKPVEPTLLYRTLCRYIC